MSEMTGVEREIAEKLLSEVEAGLASLLETGTPHLIDLRQLPRMSEAVYQYVLEALGRGETSILIDASARVEISETSCPGVWWATYHRPSGEIATEIIEINFVPRLLAAGKAETAAGLNRLRKRRAENTQALL
jgi:hydrogenase-1 operon protein HyaF